MNVEKRLNELGLVLPQPEKINTPYVPYVTLESLIVLSGQLPFNKNTVLHQGKVGFNVSCENAQEAARLCALHVLAHLKQALHGDWSRLEKCVHLSGYINCSENFDGHDEVMNIASNLMVTVLGPKVGAHTRTVVGVQALPQQSPVALDATFSIHE